MTQQSESPSFKVPVSWWRYGHVWLLLGLLTFAIAASLGLLYASIWINRMDSVYSDPLHPQDGSAPKVLQANLLPAEEAFKHAATGGVGSPNLKSASAPSHDKTSSNAPIDD